MFDEGQTSPGAISSATPPVSWAELTYGGQVAGAGGTDETAALVALLQTRPTGVSWPDIAARVLEAGTAAEVWVDLHPQTMLDLAAEGSPLVRARDQVQQWGESNMQIVGINDTRYPRRLRGVHQAPPVLFARGSLRPDDEAVSVVGSRNASRKGLDIAAGVARELVRQGLTVASGLARGVDTAAHTAALGAGGRTVAFIATGLVRTYPAENRELQARIGTRGLVLSQFWPDAPPQKHTFLMRNAVMSGYGIATVVVEAGETSGARAQARMAVAHGRPVILTDLVVDANTWARDLIGQPGVHVARGLTEVVEVIEQVREETRSVDTALRSLVSLVDVT